MNVKDADSSVIAKPVASRPSCSTFTSFSDLLAVAINASPSETTVPAIRPKTVRFKTTVNPLAAISSTGVCNDPPDKVCSNPVGKSTSVVYKPLAKVVSKTTVSLLASMGNASNINRLMQTQAKLIPSTSETLQSSEPSKRQSQDEYKKSAPSIGNTDRSSYDGYNWRKYGQKQVKGSEYPRSYYKCTHPSCPVKKKVERSLDGQIAEIVYKGEHNHSKPLPAKRSGSLVVPESAKEGGSEGRTDKNNSSNVNEVGLLYCGIKASSQSRNVDDTNSNCCGVVEEGSKGIEADEDEPKSSKRRRRENQSNDTGSIGEAIQDSRVVVQNSNDPEVSSDGFRWRKYGQKVVKGNPYPRSYYRCTSQKCSVRKHVERSSDDPKAFITTYEGKHNHDAHQRL